MSDAALPAAIAPQASLSTRHAELIAYLRERLPDSMVPAQIVALAAFPLTRNGKLDRAALPAPDERRDRAYIAPRHPLEQQIADVWEEVLGRAQISVDDPFFEIGGSSLLAVRLLDRMEARIGQRLSLRELFEAPTIAQLALALIERGWPGALRLADKLPPIEDPLVAIRPSGARPPFFFVAPLGGVLPSNMLSGFLDLTPHFDREQPYYGLQLPGLIYGLLPQLDLARLPEPARLAELVASRPDQPIVEEAAAGCVRALRRVRPRGPYMLGGFSTGGVVAFEIARQLREQGEHVALLALLDTNGTMVGGLSAERLGAEAAAELRAAIVATLATIDAPELGELTWFIGRDMAGGRVTTPLPELEAALRALDPPERWRYAADLLREVGAITPDTQPQEIRRLFVIYQLNKLSLNYILACYAPRAYPGQISFFRVADSHAPADAPTGWERLSDRPLEIRTIPGDHGTLFQQPNVRALARMLQASLDAAAREQGIGVGG